MKWWIKKVGVETNSAPSVIIYMIWRDSLSPKSDNKEKGDTEEEK